HRHARAPPAIRASTSAARSSAMRENVAESAMILTFVDRSRSACESDRVSPSRVRFLAALTAVLGTAIALLLVEVGLRATGHRPFHRVGNPRNRPVLAHDPVLGWRPQPGLWRFGPYGKDQHWASARIWPDGSRA